MKLSVFLLVAATAIVAGWAHNHFRTSQPAIVTRRRAYRGYLGSR